MTTKMLERRIAVADLLAQNLSVGEIAERLEVSERTIYTDIKAIEDDPDAYDDLEDEDDDSDIVVEVPDDGVVIVESSPQGVVAQMFEVVEDDESSIVTDDGDPNEQAAEPADEDDELDPNEWLILELEGYTNSRGIKAIAIIQKGLQLGYADGLTYEIDDESISMTRLDWTELREQFVDVAEAMPARLEKDDPNEYPGTRNQIVDMLGGLERFIEGRRSILKAA